MTTYSNLPFDIIHYLCSVVATVDRGLLKRLSVVDKRTRAASIPILFRSVAFKPRWERDQRPWDGVESRLKALIENEDIMNAVRSFHFVPWICRGTDPPLPKGFFDLVQRCSRLETLILSLQDEYLSLVQTNLVPSSAVNPIIGTSEDDVPPVFTTVRSLCIPNANWLILSPRFPHITSLMIGNRQFPFGLNRGTDLGYIAKMHRRLTTLHIPETPVTLVVDAIGRCFPDIEELGFLHGMARYHTEDSIMNHLDSFARLPKLRTLLLPPICDLGVGYNPPTCGNAYRTPGARVCVQRGYEIAVAKVVQGVEDALIKSRGSAASLQTLVLGRSSWSAGEEYGRDSEGRLRTTRIDRV